LPITRTVLVNWRRLPGLLLNQPYMSMRVNTLQLIKYCGTGTDPAAETKSIGLQADAPGNKLNRRVVKVNSQLICQLDKS
jgi:hypothetical protein